MIRCGSGENEIAEALASIFEVVELIERRTARAEQHSFARPSDLGSGFDGAFERACVSATGFVSEPGACRADGVIRHHGLCQGRERRQIHPFVAAADDEVDRCVVGLLTEACSSDYGFFVR